MYFILCIFLCVWVYVCAPLCTVFKEAKRLISSPGTGGTGVGSCRAVPGTEAGFSEPSLQFQVAVLCVIPGWNDQSHYYIVTLQGLKEISTNSDPDVIDHFVLVMGLKIWPQNLTPQNPFHCYRQTLYNIFFYDTFK